jgi:hypothetical protein
MSDTDIAAGDVWFDQIGANLAESRFAIICVTPDNVGSTWLHFEAGAIGMTSDGHVRSAVVPYLVGLQATDLAPPLSLFQSVVADKEGTLRLLRSLNDRLPVSLDQDRLERTFERWWPSLESELQRIPEPIVGLAPGGRSDRELLEEVLVLLRSRAAGADPPSRRSERTEVRRSIFTALEQVGALQGTDFSVHVNSDNVAFVRAQGVELTPELRRRLEDVIARDSIHVGPVRFLAE